MVVCEAQADALLGLCPSLSHVRFVQPRVRAPTHHQRPSVCSLSQSLCRLSVFLPLCVVREAARTARGTECTVQARSVLVCVVCACVLHVREWVVAVGRVLVVVVAASRVRAFPSPSLLSVSLCVLFSRLRVQARSELCLCRASVFVFVFVLLLVFVFWFLLLFLRPCGSRPSPFSNATRINRSRSLAYLHTE